MGVVRVAAALLIAAAPQPASALTVFDPSNFSQNVRQVAESIKAFYQRNEQLIQQIMTAANTARAVQGLSNGNYLGAVSSVAGLAGVDGEYLGMLNNARMLVLRSDQLMALADSIGSPAHAAQAAELAMTLTSNVISDSAALLARLEPMAATNQRLALAMTSSEVAVGSTQALQAQTQVAAVEAQLQAQTYEIQRLRLANELAREQRELLDQQVAQYRYQQETEALLQPVPKADVAADWWKPKTKF
ncbi:MAG: hypothetical protein RLO06_18550 [Parvibaculum sp.]|jgi:conjugal transfer/entry exclusion protein